MAKGKAVLFGDPETDGLIDQLLEQRSADNNADLVRSILVTGLKMEDAEVDRLNLKIASTALIEMLESWEVFEAYNNRPKVTIFGSARTKPDHPDYKLCVDFGKTMAERGWMAITGAGPGIMTAGIEGVGLENALGVSIVLPFEAKAAPIIHGDPKLVSYKYFFTRKLTFMKETDAFALFPGGFGTLDEAFELLTLIQTGKSYPAPVVLLDHPESTYWSSWENFVVSELDAGGQISTADLKLYTHTHDALKAADDICHFYSNYHSIRTVGSKLIVRLRKQLSESAIETLNAEFSDLLVNGVIEPSEPSNVEQKEDDLLHLQRLSLSFNKRAFGRLTSMIIRINELSDMPSEIADDLVHDVSPEEF